MGQQICVESTAFGNISDIMPGYSTKIMSRIVNRLFRLIKRRGLRRSR